MELFGIKLLEQINYKRILLSRASQKYLLYGAGVMAIKLKFVTNLELQ